MTWKQRSTTENMLVGSTTSFALGMLTAITWVAPIRRTGCAGTSMPTKPSIKIAVLVRQGHEEAGKRATGPNGSDNFALVLKNQGLAGAQVGGDNRQRATSLNF